MRITDISIRNYKSLKDFHFTPGDLTVIVGSNAAGKSNFADCIHFISEVYRHGLEVAVGRKGGYENIAFRKMRRSKQPVSIGVSVEFAPQEIEYYFHRRRKQRQIGHLRLEHSFSFVARGYSIRAAFEVTTEHLVISELRNGQWVRVASVSRTDNAYDFKVEHGPDEAANESDDDSIFGFRELAYFRERKQLLPKTDLLVGAIGRFIPGMYAFVRALDGIRVFQISPSRSREYGVPTPTPELERSGENLPAVIDLMQKRHRQEWKSVLQRMRKILPDLDAITVDYTSSRRLGLFFKETGVGRPWSVDEVSDGTIQTLALLVALFEPLSNALVIEEPENSVHPWIIRNLIDACREASERKQIVITTHSPIVMNAVRPEQLWVMWRAEGESHVAQLAFVDDNFLPLWEQGEVPTFDYIDSGAVPIALPPGPALDEGDE